MVISSQNRFLFGNKKKRTKDTCNNIGEVTEARHKRLWSVWFHLYEVQEQAKQIYDDRNQNSGCLWGNEEMD